MDKHFSLYLDLIRFLAAFFVVVAHYAFFGLSANPWLPDVGREAVMTFFVLSGYVIAYTSSSQSAQQYAVARCARIYSVVLPCVLLAFLLLVWTSGVLNIKVHGDYHLAKPYVYLPLQLLFLGEVWNMAETAPWLLPYWSLGYEVWYYVLFGLAFYLRGKTRLAMLGLVLLLVGHKLLLLAPVWLAGVYLYKRQKPLPVGVGAARALWLLTIVAFLCFKAFGVDDYLRAVGKASWPFPALRLGSAECYLADYVAAAIIYAHFVFARQAQFGGLMRLAPPIRFLAGHTFVLYLVHSIVIGVWLVYYPHDKSDWRDILYVSIAIAASTYLMGLVTERRKEWYQQRFAALFRGLAAWRPFRRAL